jgi:hypothetical protein
MDPIEVLKKKKEDDLDALMIKELYRFRILLSFHCSFFKKLIQI